MADIRINAPGAGEWIMKEVGGIFVPGCAHSLSLHSDGEVLGGFVLDGFTGVCACVHMAGKRPGWATRDLLWMLFDYAFNQLRVTKLLALVRSDNYTSMAQCLRSGWRVETLVRDMFGDGVHALVLYMTCDTCSWLKIHPKGWRSTMTVVVSSDVFRRSAA
jgi:hypothetical protein